MREITDLNQLYRLEESVPVTEELYPWVRMLRTMNETEKKREQRRRRCRKATRTAWISACSCWIRPGSCARRARASARTEGGMCASRSCSRPRRSGRHSLHSDWKSTRTVKGKPTGPPFSKLPTRVRSAENSCRSIQGTASQSLRGKSSGTAY